MNKNTQHIFNFWEQTETQTSFLGFSDFYKLDEIKRQDKISELWSALHSSFRSLWLDREFLDDDRELITNLYSLILSEIVIPDIRKVCTWKWRYPLYQKYLVLFFIEQLFRENPEEIQTLFSHSTWTEDFQKGITSLCRDNSFHGTRVSNGMIASVVFHMYQSFFTKSVDGLLENYKSKK